MADNYTIQQIKELRDRYDWYISRTLAKRNTKKYYAGFGWRRDTLCDVLEECIITRHIIDQWLKGSSLLEEAINEIALYPESKGDRGVAKGMRGIAVTAMDEMRKLYYGKE